MPWSILLGFLGSFSAPLSDYFKRKNDLAMAKLDSDTKIEEARAQLAGEIAKAELDKGTAMIGATSSNFKYFSYVLWFVPFVITAMGFPIAKQIFVNLAGLPEWYVSTCVTIQLTIWGIAISAPVVSNIFSRLSEFFDARRQAKLPEKMFYDILRSVKGNLSQAEVDAYKLAIDHANQQQGQ